MIPHPHLAQLALLEWNQRLAAARDVAARGKWSAEEANARLMPWLAIALRAGAEPPEAAADLAAIRQEPGHADCARSIMALRLCPTAEMRAELTRARDAAVNAMIAHPGDRDRCNRSTQLQYLAVFLGCPNAAANDQQRIAA